MAPSKEGPPDVVAESLGLPDSVGARLTWLIRRLRATNAEVAEATGRTAVTVSRWRNDAPQARPSDLDLAAVAQWASRHGVAVTPAWLRYGLAGGTPGAVAAPDLLVPDPRPGHEGQTVAVEVKASREPQGAAEWPRALALVALDAERDALMGGASDAVVRATRELLRCDPLRFLVLHTASGEARPEAQQLAAYRAVVGAVRALWLPPDAVGASRGTDVTTAVTAALKGAAGRAARGAGKPARNARAG